MRGIACACDCVASSQVFLLPLVGRRQNMGLCCWAIGSGRMRADNTEKQNGEEQRCCQCPRDATLQRFSYHRALCCVCATAFTLFATVARTNEQKRAAQQPTNTASTSTATHTHAHTQTPRHQWLAGERVYPSVRAVSQSTLENYWQGLVRPTKQTIDRLPRCRCLYIFVCAEAPGTIPIVG